MKIKFEIKLTASRALLTVLGALAGLSASAVNEDQQEKPKLDSDRDETTKPVTKQITEIVSDEATQTAPAPEKRTRTRKITESLPALEKIVAPAPEVKTEAEAAKSTDDGTTQASKPNEGSALTVDDIRNYAGKLIQATPALRDKVMAVLTAKGASKFSEAKPEDYADILAEFKKLG